MGINLNSLSTLAKAFTNPVGFAAEIAKAAVPQSGIDALKQILTSGFDAAKMGQNMSQIPSGLSNPMQALQSLLQGANFANPQALLGAEIGLEAADAVQGAAASQRDEPAEGAAFLFRVMVGAIPDLDVDFLQ